jgi:hypothetical protein
MRRHSVPWPPPPQTPLRPPAAAVVAPVAVDLGWDHRNKHFGVFDGNGIKCCDASGSKSCRHSKLPVAEYKAWSSAQAASDKRWKQQASKNGRGPPKDQFGPSVSWACKACVKKHGRTPVPVVLIRSDERAAHANHNLGCHPRSHKAHTCGSGCCCCLFCQMPRRS